MNDTMVVIGNVTYKEYRQVHNELCYEGPVPQIVRIHERNFPIIESSGSDTPDTIAIAEIFGLPKEEIDIELKNVADIYADMLRFDFGLNITNGAASVKAVVLPRKGKSWIAEDFYRIFKHARFFRVKKNGYTTEIRNLASAS
jgi:hypothetical protein